MSLSLPSTLARTLAACACVSLFAGCEPRPQTHREKKPTVGPLVAILDLSGGANEVDSVGFFGPPPGPSRSFFGLLRAIDDLRRDTDARAAFVRFGDASLGAARAEELAAALASLRTKLPVYCHAHGYGNTTLLAAARGCTKTWVSPAGEVEAVGIAAQILYMHKFLTEELHLGVNFLQVGKFKGAEEPFTRDGPSDEARASLETTLADLRRSWLTGIATGKGKQNLPLEDGPYAPMAAKALGLVDAVGYDDEAREAAKKETSAVREVTRFGGGSESLDSDPLEAFVRSLVGGESSAPVVVLRAVGEITMGGGKGLLGRSGGITEVSLSREIQRVEKDDAVKAVVLRIDSPGGSALASDLLWHRLMALRAKKKLVVSVGGMAASGGYYLASTGDVIFADAMSIVGSIGVVGGKIAIGDALERWGVHAETFAADREHPGAKARAAYGSALVAWDRPTEQRVYEGMMAVYDLFLARVAEGRKVDVAKVAANAEGRIFSGAEGKQRGLVDELGGLSDAIEKARTLAGLPADAKVTTVLPRPKIGDLLFPSEGDADERAPSSGATPTAVASILKTVEPLAPGVEVFVRSTLPLAEGETSVCALPFVLQIR